ncbi:unnamed protein product [Blepharisma stoltei]|uniref:Programmed cell death protein 5 n=1 Tax=Blepharisma stoltei TaxID=1481888 RepID=A0AAU9J8I2_9CILI|nr:unnamed protein product [Blepharisma stoltei]
MEQIPSPEVQKQQEEAKQAKEEQRQVMITRICDAQARERLSRVALVKPQKAREIEDMLIQMAMKGQLAGQVKEQDIIQLLEKTTEQAKTSVKIVRRKGSFDSDEEEDLNDL